MKSIELLVIMIWSDRMEDVGLLLEGNDIKGEMCWFCNNITKRDELSEEKQQFGQQCNKGNA